MSKLPLRSALFALGAGAGLLASASSAPAAVANWASDATANANPQTITNVDGSGVDVMITLGGNYRTDINTPLLNASPGIGSSTSLIFGAASGTDDSVSAPGSLTIAFFVTGTSTPISVTDVEFGVFDIDGGGTGPESVFVGPGGFSATITGSVTGSGTSASPWIGPNSAGGNNANGVSIDYGSTLLNTVTVSTFRQGADSGGIHVTDLSFQLVPEPASAALVGLAVLCLVPVRGRR